MENKTFNSPPLYFIKLTPVPQLCILSDNGTYTLGKSDENGYTYILITDQ